MNPWDQHAVLVDVYFRSEHITEFLAYDADGTEYTVDVYRVAEQYAVRFELITTKDESGWPVMTADGEPGAFDILIGAKTLRIRSNYPIAFENWDRVTPRERDATGE